VRNLNPRIKIVSGGQTGVDRAALDAAIAAGVPHGGWCPKGRRAEDGVLDQRYQLQETESSSYRERTKRNVLASDGTLILNVGELSGGTLLTQQFAHRFGKPVLVARLYDSSDMDAVLTWLAENRIKQLNVAGPRESTQPGIYASAREFLDCLIRRAPDMHPS
jgi:Circularly permutated YpsA SLOG family